MARCHLCNKYMGLGIFSVWVTRDGNRYCLPCLAVYEGQHKVQAIKEIMGGPTPQPIFAIHRMWTRDPGKPKNGVVLLGPAIFLDKGICFIHFESVAITSALWPILLGPLSWIAGPGISKLANKSKMTRAFQRIEYKFPLTDETLFDRILDGHRVLFYPFHDITRLSQDRKGFNVHLGEQQQSFAWHDGNKAYWQYKHLLEAYDQAILAQSDPMAMCDAVQ